MHLNLKTFLIILDIVLTMRVAKIEHILHHTTHLLNNEVKKIEN